MTADVHEDPGDAAPVLSTVLLNWNREDLLRKTVDSYLDTVGVSYELIIVDNASTDGSRAYIDTVCRERPEHRAILLPHNTGGEGLNIGLATCRGRFLHISENDLEYLPGWDGDLLSKFEAFPELGQLSVFSPFHQVEQDEIRSDKAAVKMTRSDRTVYRALPNVGSSCVIRREVWDAGVRWKAHGTRAFWSPDDGAFSADVKRAGFTVAWNDRYVVFNWGHHASEIERRLDYYLNNATGKEVLGLERWQRRLSDHGYDILRRDDGTWSLAQRVRVSESRAAAATALWKQWMEWLWQATQELEGLIPEGSGFLLIDDGLFGEELLTRRPGFPFLEEDGAFAGPPADDATAIRELRRMRGSGAAFAVFTWPSFWWLEHYAGFGDHLREHYPCVLDNARVVVFDLRGQMGGPGA